MATISGKKKHGQKAFIQAKIINCLRAAEGGWVHTQEILEYVYGGCVTEGTRITLMVIIGNLRKKGFPIASAQTRGYRYAPELWQPLPILEAAE